MPRFHVVFTKSAAREIGALDPPIVQRLWHRIEMLANDPRPPGSKKLKGVIPALWRIRVGDYRVIYAIQDQTVTVEIIRIGHRREVYE